MAQDVSKGFEMSKWLEIQKELEFAWESETVPALLSFMQKILFSLKIFRAQDISKRIEISKGLEIPKRIEIALEYNIVSALRLLMEIVYFACGTKYATICPGCLLMENVRIFNYAF